MKNKKKWLIFIGGIISGLILRELIRYLFHF